MSGHRFCSCVHVIESLAVGRPSRAAKNIPLWRQERMLLMPPRRVDLNSWKFDLFLYTSSSSAPYLLDPYVKQQSPIFAPV